MSRASLLLLLPLLGACSLFRSEGPAVPPGQDTPAHRACQREARRTPELDALARQENPLQVWQNPRLEEERRVIVLRAYRACLRREGLGLPGGVEPERFSR